MSATFQKLVSNPFDFFELLPQDWQDGIVPHWKNYKDDSIIYVIVENGEIIGGGIVFSTCPPDIRYYEKEAQQLFDNGYLYLGYIWIAEHKRNLNLGSFWLNELKKTNPGQNYWLLIEEEHLHRFYQKNDFNMERMITNLDHLEWLYIYKGLLT
ncbi:MAG: GNAT family N-acetyltransferase [Aquaticitalea sp.]